MNRAAILLGLLLVATVAPMAQAAVQLSQQFDCPFGEVLSIQNPGLLGVINSGQTVLCITMPHHVTRIGDTAVLSIRAVGPTLLGIAGGTAGGLISGTGTTGCTFAGDTTAAIPVAVFTAPGPAGQDVVLSAVSSDVVLNQWGTFTMTGTSCSAAIRANACLATASIGGCSGASFGAGLLYNIVIAVNIDTADGRSQVMVTNCGYTGAGETALGLSTTCGVDHLAIDSWPTLTLAGSLGVVNSGTQHLVVDSWPSLTAAVTNSGTVNVVNSGGQAMAVSGSLTVAGGLTVTNAGGESLTVTSWPQLQAVLSGAVTVHQDPICTAAAHCHIDSNMTSVSIGNTTVNVPDHQTLCGPGSTPPYNATTCKPLVGSAAVSFPGGVEAPNLPWIGMLLFLSCLIALFWWMGMAFALGWSVAAFFAHILPGLPFSLPIALGLIVIGVVLQYLNERRGERSQAPEDRDTAGVV